MGTESKSPDVLLLQTNLSGSVSDIQDDPDSPDSNWLTYISNNVDTVCHVSFPTPTGPPTEGAALQNFKIWVRQQPDGAGDDPTVRVELWEDGGYLATILNDTAVSSTTGQLHAPQWNANLLSYSDGSEVECYIYGTAVGGAPGNRCTVEIGAVEWNVTYSSIVELHGTSAGQATASGQMAGETSLSGTSAGEATAAAQATATTDLSGASAGGASAAGALAAETSLAGTSDGAATAEGTLTVTSGEVELHGSSAGQATVEGALTAQTSLAGSSAGQATAAGAITAQADLAGTSAGEASAAGSLQGDTALTGSSAGIASVIGQLTTFTPTPADIRGIVLGLPLGIVRQFQATELIFVLREFTARLRGFAFVAGTRVYDITASTRTYAFATDTRTFSRTASARSFDFIAKER